MSQQGPVCQFHDKETDTFVILVTPRQAEKLAAKGLKEGGEVKTPDGVTCRWWSTANPAAPRPPPPKNRAAVRAAMALSRQEARRETRAEAREKTKR